MEANGASGSPLEGSSCYEDDEFEEHENSSCSPENRSLGSRVHPLEAANDSGLSKLAISLSAPTLTKPAIDARDADDDDNDDNGDARYDTNDDDFEDEDMPISVTGAMGPSAAGESTLHSISDAEGSHSLGGSAESLSFVDNIGGIGEDVHASTSPVGVVREEADLVRIHCHRGHESVSLPPPAPVRDAPSSQQLAEKNLQRLRLSKQRSVVAVKRITEFRELQRHRVAQDVADAAVLKKKREQFRASNKKSYDELGVTKVTREQRYAALVEEKKLLARHAKACKALERQQRWYNRTTSGEAEAVQSRRTPSHAAHLQAKYTDEDKRRQRAEAERAQSIRARQAELHRHALALVSRSTRTAYIRGSYLLQRTRGDGGDVDSSSSLPHRHPQAEDESRLS